MIMMMVSHLDPPYTTQLEAFIGLSMLVACTNHGLNPWLLHLGLHKTIGLNHGFVHTVLYVCFLWNIEYEKEIYKI